VEQTIHTHILQHTLCTEQQQQQQALLTWLPSASCQSSLSFAAIGKFHFPFSRVGT